jgi:hypothetical protein
VVAPDRKGEDEVMVHPSFLRLDQMLFHQKT